MKRIEFIGSGFVKIIHNNEETLINLKSLSKIEKYTFGVNEDPNGVDAFGIKVYPMTPSSEDVKNGVKGQYFISLYAENEEDDFKSDWNSIISALRGNENDWEYFDDEIKKM